MTEMDWISLVMAIPRRIASVRGQEMAALIVAVAAGVVIGHMLLEWLKEPNSATAVVLAILTVSIIGVASCVFGG